MDRDRTKAHVLISTYARTWLARTHTGETARTNAPCETSGRLPRPPAPRTAGKCEGRPGPASPHSRSRTCPARSADLHMRVCGVRGVRGARGVAPVRRRCWSSVPRRSWLAVCSLSNCPRIRTRVEHKHTHTYTHAHTQTHTPITAEHRTSPHSAAHPSTSSAPLQLITAQHLGGEDGLVPLETIKHLELGAPPRRCHQLMHNLRLLLEGVAPEGGRAGRVGLRSGEWGE